MNSLTTAAGECKPRSGTTSTCNKFSTAEPTTAPAASPPMVITVAFPAKMTSNSLRCSFCSSQTVEILLMYK